MSTRIFPFRIIIRQILSPRGHAIRSKPIASISQSPEPISAGPRFCTAYEPEEPGKFSTGSISVPVPAGKYVMVSGAFAAKVEREADIQASKSEEARAKREASKLAFNEVAKDICKNLPKSQNQNN